MVQTHDMEMLSVRERNMRVWKLKKKLDDKENELTNIKRKVKEGMDTERKKLDNRRTGFKEVLNLVDNKNQLTSEVEKLGIDVEAKKVEINMIYILIKYN
ncbi:hypothetical protein CN387_10155 [Bacillus cereus]|uniref:hypothetical protein n=3 Tax=Bacillus cereus TaxID=1396 RepID=UPI000BF92029|nr:hypothetical protein [Bacillus cereus]PET03956.1 hypothetical protein CN513_31380 [Bacillus cereus]PEU42751.1 hypothetical protein CN387_10155 [Bacillus cereus]PFQ49657.1 hypothetical protein COK24_22245 [Bacillus cereus]PGP79176.1 hypothetical protein CN999_20515 [Bacillus cereus]